VLGGKMWLFFHTAILAVICIWVLSGNPIKFNASLTDLFPNLESSELLYEADRALARKSAKRVNILIESSNLRSAQKAAIEFCKIISNERQKVFEYFSCYVDGDTVDRLADFLYQYRYALLEQTLVDQVARGNLSSIANDALAMAFGSFNLTSMARLGNDPFLLTERAMRRLLSIVQSSALTVQDRLLTAKYDEKHYILISGAIAQNNLDNANAIKTIYKIADQVKSENIGVGFVYSGFAFHSYESSQKAKGEVTIISGVSLLLIAALFLYVFRSIAPIIIIFASIGVSISTAFCATLFIFDEIHILTFVFGTTIIGVSIDYSVHFFTKFCQSNSLNGLETRAQIIRGVSAGFITSIISYLLLLFASFDILKQFAVFSIFGLISSYLTFACLYPKLRKQRSAINFSKIFVLSAMRRTMIIFVLFLSLILLIITQYDKLKIHNDLSSFYLPSKDLMLSEKLVKEVLKTKYASAYFIVVAPNADLLLSRQEELSKKLNTAIDRGYIDSFMSISRFIPSIETQKTSYEAAAHLLSVSDKQLYALGFVKSDYDMLISDYISRKDRYILPDALPDFLQNRLYDLQITEFADGFFAPVALSEIKSEYENELREIAYELSGVAFINKTKDISNALDLVTLKMLVCFAAYIIAIGVLRLFFVWREIAKIALGLLFTLLAIIAVLIALNIPINLFVVSGFILVFGLSVDYIIYILEHNRQAKNDDSALIAILISFTTTELSFGALLFSSFPPVHILGIVVSIGLLSAIIFAYLIVLPRKENGLNLGSAQSSQTAIDNI
jgi:predicted exporter